MPLANRYNIKDIDNAFDAFYCDDIVEQGSFELDDGLIAYGLIRADISELGLSVREGVYCEWDEDAHDFLPDFSITLLYDINDVEPSKFIYFEQDSPYVTLHNFLRGVPNCELEIALEE